MEKMKTDVFSLKDYNYYTTSIAETITLQIIIDVFTDYLVV